MTLTAADISDRYLHLKKLWEPCWRDRFEDTDNYLKGKGGIKLWESGKGWPEHFTSVARAKISNASALMSTAKVLPHREPVGEGESHKKLADKVEPWALRLFEVCAVSETVPPLAVMWEYLNTYGYAVRELGLDGETLKQGAKDGQRLWNPIRMRAPHPATVLMDPTQRKPADAMKTSLVLGRDLKLLTMAKKAKRSFRVKVVEADKPYETWRVTEHWTVEEHAVCASKTDASQAPNDTEGAGELLYVEPHLFGFLPFDHCFSGWGRLPTRVALDQWAFYMAVGILDDVKPDILREWQLVSAIDNSVFRRAFAPLVSPYEATELMQHINAGDALQGELAKMGEFPFRDVAPGMFEMWAQARRNIEYGSYPDQMMGLQEVASQPVGTTAILREAGLRKFNVLRDQLNYLASNTASDALRLVVALQKHRGESVTIDGKTITESDLEGDYNMEMRITIVDPVIKMQQDQDTIMQFEKGLLDWETTQNNLGHEQATKIREGLFNDLVWKHPALVEYGAMQAAKRMKADAIIVEWEAKQEAEEAAQQAGGNRPQPMPMPGEEPNTPGAIPGPAEGVRGIQQGMDNLKKPLAVDVAKPAPRSR